MGKKEGISVENSIRDIHNIEKRKLSKNLISYNDPKAHASEAYRSIRTNIGFLGVDGQLKSVVDTSPGQAEGKTTTCANIAVCMAQAGRKVLLLECDLRKPKIHKYFGLHNDKGLTDIIVNNVESESVIKQVDEIENLYIISCGLLPPNPTEILESTKMINLTNKLKENYDLVIMDSPPVGELTDAAIISKMSDGVILVLASGEVNIEVARHAKIALENVNAKILGVVLTKLGRHSGSSYYYKYRYYYYE